MRIEVIATEQGYHEGLREVGDKFYAEEEICGAWFHPVAKEVPVEAEEAEIAPEEEDVLVEEEVGLEPELDPEPVVTKTKKR